MKDLIRFDWAIKSVLRDKSNFDILEGFLSAILQFDVKVLNLLESEGNKEDERDKYNRVDLLVENSNKELILIEVQVQSEMDFFHRMAYAGSKLLVEYMREGQPYGEIRKVYTICVTYFDLGEGNDYFYRGATSFTGLTTGDILGLTKHQRDIFGKDSVDQIFPENYLIRVGKFGDVIKQDFDEWIYMLKHSEILEGFKSKYIQKASEKLRVMRLAKAQRLAYKKFLENLSTQKSVILTAKIEGIKEGIKEGRKEGREEGRKEGKKEGIKEITLKLLAEGTDISFISTVTGLSLDEIKQLGD